MKKASLTVECGRPPSPRLEAVAERGEAVLDAQRLAGEAAEQHAAHDVERVRVAPGQREVDAEDERRRGRARRARAPAGRWEAARRAACR